MGLLRIRVKRGMNLVSRDSQSSDPFVVVTMGSQVHTNTLCFSLTYNSQELLLYLVFFVNLVQTLKTHRVENNCNPEWNDELTLAFNDHNQPVILVSYFFIVLKYNLLVSEWFLLYFPYRKFMIKIRSLPMTRWEMRK